MTYEITRDEGGMVVTPDDARVRKFLTLHYKAMVKEGRATKTVFMTEEMYKPIQTGDGRQGLITYQGFWSALSEHLRSQGFNVHINDTRVNKLRPNLVAALLRLRPFQQPWIASALLTHDSGLIGAPTRFGKSYGMTAICRAFSTAKTVVTAPGISLCEQLYEHFVAELPHRDVRGVYTGSKHKQQGPDITIVSMDSLDKMDPDDTDLIIVDEPHALVTEERLYKFGAFHKARKYGFGATLNGRFDKRDRLIEGAIGPVLSNVSYKEAVKLGAISPLKVVLIRVPFSKDTLPGWQERDMVYKRLLTHSSKVVTIVKKLVEEVIPSNWQMMAFIANEKQADLIMEKTMPQHGTVAMAKKMNTKERKAITSGIVSGELNRVIASNIYVQGVTFPDLRAVINLAGGGANTNAIQKPGRLLQTRPNKNYGVMFDFDFVCTDEASDTRKRKPYSAVTIDCKNRREAYENIGYDIEYVDSPARAREIVLGSYNTEKHVDNQFIKPSASQTWT